MLTIHTFSVLTSYNAFFVIFVLCLQVIMPFSLSASWRVENGDIINWAKDPNSWLTGDGTCCRVSLKMKRAGSCRLAGTFRSRISMSEVLDLFSVQVWMTRSIPSLMLLVDSQCRVWDLESCFSQKSHLSDGILPSLCRSTLLISNPFAHLMLTENHWNFEDGVLLLTKKEN